MATPSKTPKQIEEERKEREKERHARDAKNVKRRLSQALEQKDMPNASADLGYLDFPRIHFYGKFRANPCTDNNDIERFKQAAEMDFRTYRKKVLSKAYEGNYDGINWNAYGDATWSFKDCQITCAYDEDGNEDCKTYADFELNPGVNKNPGKLVDLDPYQQGMSYIYGFGLNICKKDDPKAQLMKSKYRPSGFKNMWLRVANLVPYTIAISSAASVEWISILTDCSFAKDLDPKQYKVIDDLRKKAEMNGNQLAIKWVCDSNDPRYDNDENFTYGRVHGVIGVYTVGNPMGTTKNGRYLTGAKVDDAQNSVGCGTSQYGLIKYNKETKNLFVDISNCIPTEKGKSGYDEAKNMDVGDITIQLMNETQTKAIATLAVIKPDDYTSIAKWRCHGGIYSFPNAYQSINEKEFGNHTLQITFDKDKLAAINKDWRSGPLGDYMPGQPQFSDLMSEANSAGYFAMSDELAVRMGTFGQYNVYGNTNVVPVYVWRHGKPVTDINLINYQAVGHNLNPDTTPPAKTITWTVGLETNGDMTIDKNGKLLIPIKAPKTLLVDGKLPRWDTHYMDSYCYDLYVTVGEKDVKKVDAIAPKQRSQKASTHKFTDLLKKKAKKAKNALINTAVFFVGTVLVFNELEDPVNDLPKVAVWQPNAYSDVRKWPFQNAWKEVLKDQPTKLYIHPIFRQYANMYPVMRDIINLDSYRDCTSKMSSLIRAFDAPFESSHYMPVSRDLSGQNLMLIKTWLRNPIYSDFFIDPLEIEDGFLGDIRTREQLQSYLQTAIELEISTLPPYLSALYSMDPNSNKNRNIRNLITSVVHDEMTHLCLACNLLLAIGGEPKIADRGVIERTTFPRVGLVKTDVVSVLPGLLVELSPMNLKGTIDTFMQIEAPCTFDLGDEEDMIVPVSADDDVNAEAANDDDDDDDGDDESKKNEEETKNAFFTTAFLSPAIEKMKDELVQKNKNLFKQRRVEFTRTKLPKRLEALDENNDDDDEKKTKSGHIGSPNHTIGAFYELIRKGFRYLNWTLGTHKAPGKEGLFVVNHKTALEHQVGPAMMKGCNYVHNLETAMTAIGTIVDEGEGTSLTDIWSGGADLSHFHKFLEIAVQKPILEVRRKISWESFKYPYAYVFANDVTIPFNPDHVESNPTAWDWLKLDAEDPDNNANEPRVVRFNEDYGKMLIAIQELFDEGDLAKRKGVLQSAISLMRQLQIDFSECIRPPTKDGKCEKAEKDTPLLRRVAPNWVPPTYIIQ